ncbi:hypothetical protein [Deinococcus cellulosilyticus]|uniref:DUF551 domain-containing protein n=1 Tax=Deinococcus cellulosilyticus (strain DSM 18568 / NBRC 106333 / KACC 11606 / 5516J-15) TaxID=1223518 RepID=A0A511N7J5_DEIC1|nr:hypothetical protein [Deinococcus cellulosilyticus]GEM48812.1 hypothetical protein DC3_44470 [Deinococcus cellulosilyticus NBRC 106333 = KACC 11606]
MTLPTEIQAIKDRWSKATKGPWQWSGYVSRDSLKQTDINLTTTWGGRRVVMMFERVGFRDAQPWFQPQPGDLGMQPGRDLVKQDPETGSGHISGINHPDAEAIAHAPEDVRMLLQEVDRLRAQVPSWTPITQPPAESGTYLVIMSGFPVVLFYNAEEGFWDDDEQTDALVTHWMPILPTPEDA